ncbi:hypothetical protein BofuT4_P050210.1 [Botrytis cinerea T4]|uniref:Uncharacterized protein n=1 Tax=Botryotinia fuckeliana (strain T4) TaxID=999810 RepID=G2XZW6_BOTF4|nr:hypothetical protein BofuT4_P050210.1 [Botrytis cinerea T4]
MGKPQTYLCIDLTSKFPSSAHSVRHSAYQSTLSFFVLFQPALQPHQEHVHTLPIYPYQERVYSCSEEMLKTLTSIPYCLAHLVQAMEMRNPGPKTANLCLLWALHAY